MAIAKKNTSAKALQAFMAKAKKVDEQTRIEWEMACNTNNQRGHVFDQSEINVLYSRDDWKCGKQGATKTTHITCHNGNKFQFIVVKRHQTDGYIDEHANDPNTKQTGNQLIDEIQCWQEFASEKESDFLCPILKFFTSKSDKVAATSETMQKNVVIIAQKALFVGNLSSMCRKAGELNNDSSEAIEARYCEMCAFSKKQGWRDAIHNPGNSGIIFDYATNRYKAVFIDYAL